MTNDGYFLNARWVFFKSFARCGYPSRENVNKVHHIYVSEFMPTIPIPWYASTYIVYFNNILCSRQADSCRSSIIIIIIYRVQ